MVLSQYIKQVRRLLNDSQRNYWADDELADYVNEGRKRTAIDTKCCRKFQPTQLSPGQEQYEFTDPGLALPQARQIVDIINITIIWGSSRIQLGYLSFTELSAKFRPWVNYQRTPCAFTVYNNTEFWVAYMPDIIYPTELDLAIVPLNLVDDDSVDTLNVMYDAAPKYYAAHLARLRLQQYTEAKAQEELYMKEIARIGAMPPRRIPYVFQNEIF